MHYVDYSSQYCHDVSEMCRIQRYISLLVIFLKSCNNMHLPINEDNEQSGGCQCVPSHLCKTSKKVTRDQGFLDIRFAEEKCPNYYDVCCETLKDPQQSGKGCGYQNSALSISPRITKNSESTEFGELPWTVLILQKQRKIENNGFICGGSLIHPQVVITAGHCVHSSDTTQIKIRAGDWNIRNTQEPLPHQDSFVKEILIHPGYKEGTLWNDVAILFLNKPFKTADNIGFICLTPKNMKINVTSCTASGWGKNAFMAGRNSAILRKVEVPIVGRSKCLISLRNTRLGKFFKLHRSFICAGGKKYKDACKGDGGSPLICPYPGHRDRFFQMGIVSWGIGCGLDKTPGVYVNLPLYTEWIDNSLMERNLSTSYYKA